MKKSDIVLDFTSWDGIGRYIVQQSPSGGLAAGVEEVIKMRELDQEMAKLIAFISSKFKALRINIINHADGSPDRVEVYRLRG